MTQSNLKRGFWGLAWASVVIAGCGGTGDGVSAIETAVEEAVPTADGAKADSAAATEWRSTLFLKTGFFGELSAALDQRYTRDYRVLIPGVLEAYVSYGGDMMNTRQPAGMTLERVFDRNPGGAVLGVFESYGWASGTPRGSHTSAKALFDALTRGRETRTVDGGRTDVTRASRTGRVSCVKSNHTGYPASYRCTFKDLMFLRAL